MPTSIRSPKCTTKGFAHRGKAKGRKMFEAMDAQLIDREFHLEVQVGDQWKGVHVQNQSQGDGAELVRHSRQGNRVKFTKSTEVPDGYHILVEVAGSWKGVHVQNQSADDNARLVRHAGDGNVGG